MAKLPYDRPLSDDDGEDAERRLTIDGKSDVEGT